MFAEAKFQIGHLRFDTEPKPVPESETERVRQFFAARVPVGEVVSVIDIDDWDDAMSDFGVLK